MSLHSENTICRLFGATNNKQWLGKINLEVAGVIKM